jgi:ABC-type glycerol-3-phosphate transport system substrate-binding protein
MTDSVAKVSSKKFSRREFLSLAGTVTAGAILAACAPVAVQQPQSPAGGEQAVAEPPKEEVVELIAWFTDRLTINKMTEMEAIPDFQSKNPGFKVTMQFVPESELQQKLLTSKAAGNAPDVSSLDETFLDTLTKQDVLLPIPEEVINVGEEMGDLTENLYRIPPDASDAKFYGLPNGVFSSQIYYNAGLLAELGYKPEDIPTNWSDFIKWATDVTVWDGDTLDRTGMAFYANEFSMYEDLRFQIAGPIDGNFFPTQDSTRHTDEVGIQSWQFIMDLYDVHKLDSKAEGLNSRERFGGGRAVTLYNWTWFNGFMDTQYTDIDWGLVIPPTMDGAQVYGRRGPDVGFTVTTQNEAHMTGAWTLYRYLVSPVYLAKYCKLRGIQPSLKEMWDDPEFSDKAGPRWGAIAVKNRPENSVDPGFWPLELVNINNRILPSIRDEGEDIQTVLAREEEEGNKFLQASPQWSILSAEQYKANPQWLTPAG